MFESYTLLVVGMDSLEYVESEKLSNVQTAIAEAVAGGNSVLFLEDRFESTRTELTALVPDFGATHVVKYDGEIKVEQGKFVSDDGADAIVERCNQLGLKQQFKVCGMHAQREVLRLIRGLCGRHDRQVLVIKAACVLSWDFLMDIPNLVSECPSDEFEFMERTCMERMRRIVRRHPEDFADEY